jgi:predicted KAP-like P-loop ATPase
MKIEDHGTLIGDERETVEETAAHERLNQDVADAIRVIAANIAESIQPENNEYFRRARLYALRREIHELAAKSLRLHLQEHGLIAKLDEVLEQRGAEMIHNLVAHPLLVLWPKMGERLHKWTADRMGETVLDERPGH